MHDASDKVHTAWPLELATSNVLDYVNGLASKILAGSDWGT